MGQQPSSKPVFPPEIAPYIDVAAYLLDARAPAATLYLDQQLSGKELMVLTRAGQAAPKETARWQEYLAQAGYPCIAVDSLTGEGLPAVLDRLARLHKLKIKAGNSRGIAHAVLRVVALGVPNVGKSTFLNKLLGAKRLKVANRPGVTRGPQWVRVFEDVEVLDTAGILRDPALLHRRKPYWMLLNLMPYDFTLREEAVELLRSNLTRHAQKNLRQLYRIPGEQDLEEWQQLLAAVGSARGFTTGDDDGLDRAARTLMRDFQKGRLGRLTLERAGEAQITSPYFKGNPPRDASAPSAK
jgi:ribosome biogenesis GTPase A